MSGVRTGVGYAPTDPQHVATKTYVDTRTPKIVASTTAPADTTAVWIDIS